MKKNTKDLPTIKEVWEKVQNYAQMLCDNEQPLYTLDKDVENFITDVKAKSIGRESEQGKTNRSRVEFSHVKNLWEELQGKGKGKYLYLTKALLLKAVPEWVEFVNGELRIRRRSAPSQKRQSISKAKKTFRGHGGGGEGDLHLKIKEFIYNKPNEALAGIGGAPFQGHKKEYVLETADKIDVVLIDNKDNIVIIEVKPFFVENRAPFAQAAKYRAQWCILEDLPPDKIRCVVAAPRIKNALKKEMKEKYKIESVEIK